MHREFDLNALLGQTLLKVAFKFVALKPGVAVLKSFYSSPRSALTGGAVRQSLRVIVSA